jgi:hypothetical protein
MWMTRSMDAKAGPSERAPTPLPKLSMAVCFCLQISEALNVTTLFPYVSIRSIQYLSCSACPAVSFHIYTVPCHSFLLLLLLTN